MNKIQAILLDFDDTLSSGPAKGYYPIQELKELFHLTEEQVGKILELDFKLLLEYYLPEVSMHVNTLEKEQVLHHRVFSIIAREANIDKQQEFVAYMINYRMNSLEFVLYPEVEASIKRLHDDGYKLYIFTNALPSRRREVNATSIGKYFEDIFISNELGCYKPQKEFYEYALKKIDISPENVLLVDDKEALLLPAKELGMEVVHIDRKGKYPASSVRRLENISLLF